MCVAYIMHLLWFSQSVPGLGINILHSFLMLWDKVEWRSWDVLLFITQQLSDRRFICSVVYYTIIPAIF